MYSRRGLRYLLEARGLCSLRRAVAPGGVPGGVCVLPEELAILTGSPGLCSLRRAVAPGGVPGGVCILPEELAILTGSPGGFVRSGELWCPEACPEACVYSRRSLQYLGTGSPGGFVRSGELWCPEACPEACVYSRRSLQYLLEARGLCSLRRAVAPGGVPGGVCVLPEELAILTGSPGALFALESCGARRRARRRVYTPGGACNTYWKPGGLCSLRRAVAPGGVPGGVCVLPEELAILTGSPGGFVRSGELWRPEACPEACVYSRRSLQYLLEARGALFAPESCGARRRARRRVCTPGGACNTYWKPGDFVRSRELWCPEACVYSRRGLQYLLEARGALFAPESCGARRRARRRVCTPGGACDTYWKLGGLCSLRRAVAPGGVPGGVCVLPEELAILTGSPGGFVRSGELWRPEACPEACVYSRRSLQYLLEAWGALFAPESCSARRRAPRRVCVLPEELAILTGKPGGLCSLRRAVVPGGVPGGVCVLPEELAILTGSPVGFVRSGELWRPEACPEACMYSRRSLQYLLEARGFVRSGELWRPEACPEACVYSRRNL